MNVNEHTSGDMNTHGVGKRPPCTGLAPDVLPEVQKPVWAENSQTGVSIRYVLLGSALKTIKRKPTIETVKKVDGKRKTVEESRLSKHSVKRLALWDFLYIILLAQLFNEYWLLRQVLPH